MNKKIIVTLLSCLTLTFLITFSISITVTAKENKSEKKSLALINSKNIEKIKKHILPEKSKVTWQTIPWLSTMTEGVVKAQEEKKPIFLWAMNGHPLGCT